MDVHEIILKYFEKEISQEEEIFLFSMLSQNNELREEFNTSMFIEKNITNTSLYYPAQDSVNKLFSNLGYNSNFISNTYVPKSFGIKSILNTIQSVLMPIAALFIFSIPNGKITENNTLNYSDKISIQSNNQTVITDTEPVNNVNTLNKISKKTYQTYEQKSNEIVEVMKTEDISEIEEGQVPVELSFSNLKNELKTYSQLDAERDNYLVPFEIESSSEGHFFDEFSLELSYAGFLPFKKVDIASADKNFLCNSAFSIYYRINENYELGAEVKTEEFSLMYDGEINNRTLYSIEQNSQITSYGLNIRYYPFEFSEFNPYLQLGAGANRFGFVTRAGLGLTYQIYNWSLIAYSDITGFIYKHIDNYNVNYKSGFHFIVKLKL